MSDELEVHRVNAALFGIGGNNNIGNIVQTILQVKFSDAELQAILTVLGIVLKAAGLQGLQDFVSMLVRLEQQFIATKTPAANTASK